MSQDPFQEREAEKYANPIPSREFILEHLTKREKPASRDELAIELNIEGEEQTEALRRRLRAMERDGQLVFTRRQCYALPERLDLLKGTVIGHRDGYGFLRVEGRKDDLYLSSEQMKTCIHGDQVLAQLGQHLGQGRLHQLQKRLAHHAGAPLGGGLLLQGRLQVVQRLRPTRVARAVGKKDDGRGGGESGGGVHAAIVTEKAPSSAPQQIGRAHV